MNDKKFKNLEKFVVDNGQLEELERHLSEFNIFEAVGIARQELRHSDFLSFMLDPSRNHGLGDSLIKNIGKDILSKSNGTSINAIEIDVMDLEGLEVRREWRNIDLLLIEKEKEILIVVENKIDSTEGSDQLKRYSKRIEALYPNYRKLKIFLTPEDREPSQDDWLSYSYKEIYNQLDKIVESKRNVIGAEIINLITHYNEMLRRHIMEESEITKLCQSIYKNHKDALDLIFENKPDMQLDLSEYLRAKIKDDPNLNSDGSSKTYIRFSIPTWDSYEAQSSGSNWTDNGNILLFEFRNRETSLNLALVIGPGPNEIRNSLYQASINNQDKLQSSRKSLTSKWTQIHQVPVLSKKELENSDFDQLCNIINRFWNNRLYDEIEKIKPIFEGVYRSMNSA